MGNRSASLLICVITLTAAVGGAFAQTIEDPGVPPNDIGTLVMFPSRDFLTLEGFQDNVGETFKTEVLRGTSDEVVGAAWSKVDLGDVAYEVNHPGGYCWGSNVVAPAGKQISAQLQVTPDIQPGDKVRVRNELGKIMATSTIIDVYCETPKLSGTTLTITGRYAGVPTNQLEVRIIQPDLVDTDVTRRDVRAVTGGLVTAPKGGYQSNLAASDGSFVATFEFENENTAAIAQRGGARAMAWEKVDTEGNRLSITIYEDGELGGPGFGGCPNSPSGTSASPGTFRADLDPSANQITFSFTQSEAAPGASPVTAYLVAATEPCAAGAACAELSGVHKVVKHNANQATYTTILSANTAWTPSVRSINGQDIMAAPYKKFQTGGTQTGPRPNVLTCSISASNLVTFSNIDLPVPMPAGRTVADYVYYTFDKPVYSAGGPVFDAIPYEGPFLFKEGAKEVHWVLFNAAGDNYATEIFTRPAAAPDAKLAAPTVGTVAADTGTAGQESVTARWGYPDNVATTFTAQLAKTDANGALPDPLPVADVMSREAISRTERSFTFSKAAFPTLAAGSSYKYRVRADPDGEWSSWSDKFTATPKTDVVQLSGARWRSGSRVELRVVVAASSDLNAVDLFVGNAAGPTAATPFHTILAADFLDPVAPSTMYQMDLTLRGGRTPTTFPAYIWGVSKGGGRGSTQPRNGRRLRLRRQL